MQISHRDDTNKSTSIHASRYFYNQTGNWLITCQKSLQTMIIMAMLKDPESTPQSIFPGRGTPTSNLLSEDSPSSPMKWVHRSRMFRENN